MEYYLQKTKIDKALHLRLASKIQQYNNNVVDKLVNDFDDAGVNAKTPKAVLTAELSILNKPEVYKNYNKIIQSKYTSDDAINNMLVKNQANKDLEHIVAGEVERISKNLDYVNEVLRKYELPTHEYNRLLKEQANSSISNRKELIEKIVKQANELLSSDKLEINNNVFTYRNLEADATSYLRQSQMAAENLKVHQINDNVDYPDKLYTHKVWIHTHRGETTRHTSNHLQKVPLDEPFIVVNDKTLHIDEMMYPCDPTGSFQNAWICYCECEYRTGDINLDGYYTSPLKQKQYNVNVSFGKTTPSLNKPTAVTVETVPVKTYIDVDGIGVKSIPHNYLINVDEASIVEFEGKYYYNGLEVKEYNKYDNTVKVSKSAVTKHNNNLTEPDTVVIPTAKVDNDLNNNEGIVKSVIDTDVVANEGFYSNLKDEYTIFNYMDIETVNGKKYYNGLDITPYWDSNSGYADVPAHIIEAYNQSLQTNDNVDIPNNQINIDNNSIGETVNNVSGVTVDNTLADENKPKNKPIDLTKIMYEDDIDAYTFFESDYEKIGDKYYVEGLDISQYKDKHSFIEVPKQIIDDYNNNPDNTDKYKLNNDTEFKPDKQVIKIDNLLYNEDENTYTVTKSSGLVEANGKYYYRGLDVTDNVGITGKVAYIPAEKIIEHNLDLGASTFAEDKIHEPKKEKINVNHLTYDDDIEAYVVTSYDGVVEYDDKYYYKGLELDHYSSLNEEGFVSADKITEHNNEFENESGYVRNSKIIERVEDVDNDRVYAVDTTTGKRYIIDKNKDMEREQDRLQKKIDMEAHKKGMYGWAVPDYADLNLLLLGKGRFSKYHNIMEGKVLPLLDEIYDRTDKGKSINRLLKQYEDVVDEIYDMDNDDRVRELLWEYVDMEQALAKSPALIEDMMFIRDGYWEDEWNEVGGIFEFKPYQSTTYKETGAGFNSSDRYRMTILAPAGTRGTRMNSQYGSITSEREWLTKRNQKFEVLEFNDNEVYDAELGQYYKGTVTIRLIND